MRFTEKGEGGRKPASPLDWQGRHGGLRVELRYGVSEDEPEGASGGERLERYLASCELAAQWGFPQPQIEGWKEGPGGGKQLERVGDKVAEVMRDRMGADKARN